MWNKSFLRFPLNVLLDGLMWFVVMGAALWLRFPQGVPSSEWEFFWRFIPFSGTGMLLSLSWFGVYREYPINEWAWKDIWWGYLVGVAASFGILFLLQIPYSRWAFLVGSVSYLAALVILRLGERVWIHHRTRSAPLRTVAVGFDPEEHAPLMGEFLPDRVELRFVQDHADDPSFEYLQQHNPELIVINGDARTNDFIRRVSDFGSRIQVPVRVYPSRGDLFLSQTTAESWNDFILLRSNLHHRLQQQLAVKDVFDYVLGGLLFFLTLPFMCLIGVFILFVGGRPILFCQERVGRRGRRFQVYKFRTMIHGADREGPGLTQGPHDPRITEWGRFLRRWSLDELPQLWNVLRGEMSLVGPRPEIPSITSDYNSLEQRIFWLKPGLTGLSQVSGRENLELSEKLRIDQYYLNEYSIGLDCWILLKTLWAVIKGTGSN